jgi:ABC-2 type transport system ATP-binding protein
MANGPVGVAVEAVDLRKRYGARAVLEGVTFSVASGEVFALLGPNGAGKTTTVEILEGYRRADGGTVRVLGLDPASDGARLRPRIGLMLQEGGVDPRTTPREAARLYASLYADPDDPDALLERVGLEERTLETRYRRLSGGERQRLGLALALVGRPELLVLDEPTAGMDPAARQATRQLVADLRDAGTTVLLTTHDLGDVEALADRVAILDRGRIVALGTPAELTGGGRPRIGVRFGPGSAERAAAPGLLDELGAALVGRDPDARVVPAGPDAWEVVGAAPTPALVAAVAAWCAERDLLVSELRVGAASLEARYLELVGPDAREDVW